MKYKKLFVSILIASVAILLHTGHAHAATINVAGGCSLDDAIVAINTLTDGTCTKTGSYGSSDTITIPVGTQTLTADLSTISKPMTISGAGIGSTVINGNSHAVFHAVNTGVLSIHDMTVQNFIQKAFYITPAGSSSVELYNIEVKDNVSGFAMVLEDVSDLDIHDVYIHDVHQTNDPSGELNIQSEVDATVSLKRISIIDNSGGFSYDANSGTNNVNIENMTVSHNFASFAGSNIASLGFLLQSAGNAVGHTPILNASVKNSTLFNNSSTLASPYDQFYPSSGFLFGSGSEDSTYGSGTNNVTLENNLLASITLNGNGASCGIFDNSAGGSSGTNSGLTVTSLGHNYSDDNACSSYLTDSTDKNNLTSLTSSMGSLDTTTSNIPAFALLNTSPAINGGATVAGLTTDARGVARPQCNAYDVGAYEYNDDCSAIDNASSDPGDNSGSGSNSGGNNNQGSNNSNNNISTSAPHTGLASASPMLAGIFVGGGIVSYLAYRVLKRRSLV